jgi:hypothetical protein
MTQKRQVLKVQLGIVDFRFTILDLADAKKIVDCRLDLTSAQSKI